jgi:hypothetical protein
MSISGHAASGQGPGMAASPEASTGWPTTLGSDGQAVRGRFFMILPSPVVR